MLITGGIEAFNSQYLTVNSPLYRIVQKWKEHKWNVQILFFVLVNFHWNFVQRFKWQFEAFWAKVPSNKERYFVKFLQSLDHKWGVSCFVIWRSLK